MKKRIPGCIAAGLLLLALLLPEGAVAAHPADMYAQQQSVMFTLDELQVVWKITPGPLLAGAFWQAADQNRDGSISQDEAAAWFKPFSAKWTARFDNQSLGEMQGLAIHWPDKLDILQAGDEPIQIQFAYRLPPNLAGEHPLELHNAFQEGNSLNWFTLKGQQGLTFDEPEQINGLLRTRLHFPSPGGKGGGTTAALDAWESGRPALPGFSGAISNVTANLASSGGKPNAANQANPISGLLSLIRTQNFSPWFLIGAFLLSLALGSLHALTPGHGKALVAAYLVGSHGRTRDAISLGSIVTLTHTGSVLLIGLITLVASRYILPTLMIPWLEILSGLLVIGFGINLLIRRGGEFFAWRRSERAGRTAKHITAVKQKVKSTRAVDAHSHGPGHSHSHPGHSHADHTHAEAPQHEHTHQLPGNQVTWRSLVTLGISGGLVPCPDAIAILLVAVAVNRITFGMLLILSFSIGLALVLIGIGIAMVHGVRFISRSDLLNRFSVYTPVISAVAVMVLGFALTASAMRTAPGLIAGQGASPTTLSQNNVLSGFISGLFAGNNGSAPGVDLSAVRLAYISQDSQKLEQLYAIPLSGGSPTAYTQEPSGILSFAVAPDGKTILYSLLDRNGQSSIWAVDGDGSHRRQILDCQKAVCENPVWSPDGQKLVYERREYSSNSALILDSIWRMDLKSGETTPVFRDQRFPSYSPRFSPDGQWLSYISPANNTIQVYNLRDGRSFAFPSRSNVPEIWSPLSDSILFWDAVTQGNQTTLRLKRYDLSTAKIIDLDSANDPQAFFAAWSPDGQWIALIRGDLKASSTDFKEQVWLMHPDGSRAHVLLDEDAATYNRLSWSSDSRYLAYDRFLSKNSLVSTEIWVADTQSGRQSQVTPAGWQPVFLP